MNRMEFPQEAGKHNKRSALEEELFTVSWLSMDGKGPARVLHTEEGTASCPRGVCSGSMAHVWEAESRENRPLPPRGRSYWEHLTGVPGLPDTVPSLQFIRTHKQGPIRNTRGQKRYLRFCKPLESPSFCVIPEAAEAVPEKARGRQSQQHKEWDMPRARTQRGSASGPTPPTLDLNYLLS